MDLKKVLVTITSEENSLCKLYCEFFKCDSFIDFEILDYFLTDDYNEFGFVCMEIKKSYKTIMNELIDRNQSKTVFTINGLIVEYNEESQPTDWGL